MKNKPRHNPNKKQNLYGTNYECDNFDIINNKEYCHDEHNVGLNEFVAWWNTKNGKLICNGNRHNCIRNKLKWKASTKEKNYKL